MATGIYFVLPVILSFAVGVVVGYKAKEYRIKWTRRKRDKLLAKLNDTQKQLEVLSSI